MSHHSSSDNEEARKHFNAMFNKSSQAEANERAKKLLQAEAATLLGPDGQPRTSEIHQAMRKVFGEYPDGRLNKDDAGSVACEIGEVDGRVVLRFPKPVAWIGFTGDEAMRIAQALMQHARKAGLTKPFELSL